jgi:3-dehydroquinate synthase
MKQSSFSIKYQPVHPGTENTTIIFHPETPDLCAIFTPGRTSGERRFFVTDGTVARLPCIQQFTALFDDGRCGRDYLLVIGSGEPYKTIESVLTIVKAALKEGFARKDIFVGIGGGVISDITGFAASIFKRGTSVEFVPTTLLSMVDASIGGKTGCDFDNYKNMIGSFFPARTIHIFPRFVESLSSSQYNSGLAEAFKTALLYDRDLYTIFLEKSESILSRDPAVINEIIPRCAHAKAKIVENDFMENNIRMYLNFGHTFGHALETVVGLGNITHGSAVAWGIGRALSLSARKNFCSQSYCDEVLKMMLLYGWDTEGMPHCVTGGDVGGRIIKAMHKDKKNSNSKICLILQKGLNDTFILEMDDDDILPVLK